MTTNYWRQQQQKYAQIYERLCEGIERYTQFYSPFFGPPKKSYTSKGQFRQLFDNIYISIDCNSFNKI